MKVAHAQVALLCMCYIAAMIKYWPLFDTKMAQKTSIALSESLPLLQYTFRHGFRHLEYLEAGNSTIIDGMIALRLDIE